MENVNPTYPISITLRIDWCDMDIFKHVNNVMYFKYIQSARVNYWEQAGLADMYKNEGIIAMLLSTQCRYLKPLYYPGNVIIKSSVSFIKNTSFGLIHQLFNDQGDLVAELQDVMVLFDDKTQVKITVPQTVRARIMSLEKIA
jgi:acyl-CoA thioester hydrolase